MSFTDAPQWTNEGVAPSETLKTNGFAAGYKPPATVFNYLFNKYGICLTELQNAANSTIGKSGEGNNGEIFNNYSLNVAKGDYAHAEGYFTKAYGDYSHCEGHSTHTSIDYAHAEGYNTYAQGNASHAEGNGTDASQNASHAEGSKTKAIGNAAHSEGSGTTASGNYSHAGGLNTTASGDCSYATGHTTTAEGIVSHASGYKTKAKSYQTVTGKNNAEKKGCTSSEDQSTDNSIFIVGYGTEATPANAFRITAAGKCYGAQSFGGSGADYAEYFEWLDGNENNEDRRGLFVTLDGDKIRPANATDDYIVGVISANPSIIGDVQSENWHGMYKKDIFGQPLTETVEIPESTDETTGEVIPAHTITRYVVNPNYNPDKEYTSREFRKEWACVGLMGKLIVVDDGTCEVNGYCKAADGGKATKADTGYRVMKRLDDTHIQILYR